MRKNTFYILTIIVLFFQKIQAQYIAYDTVFNPTLLAQITVNNGMRLTSLEIFRKSFKKQSLRRKSNIFQLDVFFLNPNSFSYF